MPSRQLPSPGLDDGASRLMDHTSDMLRFALDAQVIGRFPNASVRRSLRGVCREAQRGGMRAEQLLVILKDAWQRLPETRRISREDRDAALAQVVSLCIREYYAAQDPSIDESPGDGIAAPSLASNPEGARSAGKADR